VKACLDCAGGQFKKHRCLSGIILFDVAEDENGTIPHGKLIDAATHELADLPTLKQCFEWYKCFRVRLSAPTVGIELWHEIVERSFLSPLIPTDFHERRVYDDAMEPAAQRGPFLESVDVPEGLEERVLDTVPRILLNPDEPPSDSQHSPAISFYNMLIACGVPIAQSSDQAFLIRQVQSDLCRAVWFCIHQTSIYISNCWKRPS
jgi:hypothetical protein